MVESTESAPVTWAIDPTLLPSLLPKDTGEPGAGGEPADSKSTEVSARQAMEDRIRSVAGQHTPWVLPDVDADVAAVADSGKPSALASTLVSRPPRSRLHWGHGATSRGPPTAATPPHASGRWVGSTSVPALRPRLPPSRACPWTTTPRTRTAAAATAFPCSPTTTS